MDKILNEVKEMRKEFLDNLLLDQLHSKSYIDEKCTKCAFHSEIFHNNRVIHLCNDVWSGDWHVGKHIFYSETKDICIECDGFKDKNG
jgi:hypothetical protein